MNFLCCFCSRMQKPLPKQDLFPYLVFFEMRVGWVFRSLCICGMLSRLLLLPTWSIKALGCFGHFIMFSLWPTCALVFCMPIFLPVKIVSFGLFWVMQRWKHWQRLYVCTVQYFSSIQINVFDALTTLFCLVCVHCTCWFLCCSWHTPLSCANTLTCWFFMTYRTCYKLALLSEDGINMREKKYMEFHLGEQSLSSLLQLEVRFLLESHTL